MGYSNRLLKGTIGYNPIGWATIITERAKSDKPDSILECEVFGDFHECGSMYYNEFTPAHSLKAWEDAVKRTGENPEDRYFRGELVVLKE